VSSAARHQRAAGEGSRSLFWMISLLVLGWAALGPRRAELPAPRLAVQSEPELQARGEDASRASERALATAWAGLLAGLLAPLVVLVSPWPALALLASLIFVLAGLGSGVACRWDAGEDFAQAALTLILSLTLFALAATIMIWLAAWHPVVLLALALPSVLSCLHLLARSGALSSSRRSRTS
jgi:hypothetical protein